MAQDKGQLAAAIVFLIAYIPLACLSLLGLIRRRPRLRFFGIFFFASLRLGSQVCGVGTATVGLEASSGINWLIAYLILGAEGYFALVLAMFYCLNAYMHKYFEEGSWIEPRKDESEPRKRRLHFLVTPSFWFHELLIVPNVLVIVGGSEMSKSFSNPSDRSKIEQGRKLRDAGSALFLVFALGVVCILVHTFWKARQRRLSLTPLWLLVGAAPLIIVRGIFGILQTASAPFSYYNLSNYSGSGLSKSLLLGEYVMGAFPEYIGAVCLLLTNWRLTEWKNQPQQDPESRPMYSMEAKT